MAGANNDGHPNTVTQRQRFEQLARELEADEDETRWDERLAKVVTHKPATATEKPE